MPSPVELPRLVATDLDGTLLGRDGSISARTLGALKRARAAGIELLMVTGRPARHVAKIAGVPELGGSAICVNGALIYDLDRELVVREERLTAIIACQLVQELRLRLPGICFAVEVGLEYGWEPNYALLRKRAELPRLPIVDALTLCAHGVNKLIARHPQLSADELLARSQDLFLEQARVSYSGAPILEISAAAVSKASALTAYCAQLSIDKNQVLSFGDMPNDLPMLEWAGHSVAMAQRTPERARGSPRSDALERGRRRGSGHRTPVVRQMSAVRLSLARSSGQGLDWRREGTIRRWHGYHQSGMQRARARARHGRHAVESGRPRAGCWRALDPRGHSRSGDRERAPRSALGRGRGFHRLQAGRDRTAPGVVWRTHGSICLHQLRQRLSKTGEPPPDHGIDPARESVLGIRARQDRLRRSFAPRPS